MTIKIDKNENENAMTIALEGRLDTAAAPELDKIVDTELEGVKSLIFDMAKLEYISSSGIRVILKALKTMNEQGAMKLINVNDTVMEVFDITGFLDILTIE